MDLGLSTRDEGRSTVVEVSGELDVFTAPALADLLTSLVADGRTELVVDLSGVSFLDSTGLGSILRGLKGARDAGGSVQVVASSEKIVKVFRITGLEETLKVVGSVTEALES